MSKTLVVYLHGFRSSPRSSKAVMTGDAIKKISGSKSEYEWYCPQLHASPKESMDMVTSYIDQAFADHIVVIGSSLGGFYANYLAEKYACKAIVLNPAVRAARELAPHVGMMTAYDSDEPFDFRPEYIKELEAIQVERISKPNRYYLIAAKGDELLNWQEMSEFYTGTKQLILEGSDHGLTGFEEHLPTVLEFLAA